MTIAAIKSETYYLLHPTKIETRAQHVVRYSIIGFIGLSLVVIVGVSVPRIEHSYGPALDAAEALVIIAFVSEYVLRVWSSTVDPKFVHPFFGRLKYALTFMALADLLAILPIIAPQIIPVNLNFVRSARLIGLLGLIEAGRHSASMGVLLKVLHSKRHELNASFVIIGILILCASIVMYHIENPVYPDKFSSVPASFWWSVSMVTTISNYSAIFPLTLLGKICAIAINVLGITAIALPGGIIVTGLMEEYQAKTEILCAQCKSSIHR